MNAATPKTEDTIAARGTASRSQMVLLGATAARLVLSLVITVLLGRALAPGDFGFFALVSTLFVLAREVVDLGTGNMAAREIVRDPARERPVLEALLGGRRLLGLALALACLGLAWYADTPERRLVLGLAALGLVFVHLTAFHVVFQVRQAFSAPSVLGIGSLVLMLAACAAGVLLKAAGALFALFAVAREVLVFAGNRLLALQLLPWRPHPRLRGASAGRFYRKALVIGLASVFYNLLVHGGTFFIWFLRPEAELGAYAAAFRPIYPLMSLPWILMIPLVPVLSRLASTQRPRFAPQVWVTLQAFAGIGLSIAVAGWLLAPAAVGLLYGAAFSEGPLSAVDTLRWLSMALAFAGVVPVLATALLADGREKTLFGLGLAGMGVDVALNLILVPRLGFEGAAVSAAVTEGAVLAGAAACTGYFLRRGGGLRDLALFCLPGLCLLGVLPLLPENAALQLSVGGLLTAAALVAVWSMPRLRQMRAELAGVSTFAAGEG